MTAYISDSPVSGQLKRTQEKPTNCGTKAADVLAYLFLLANFNANPVNILV